MTNEVLARALRATLEMKLAEIATIENAIETIEGKEDARCDERCGLNNPNANRPCYGPVSGRMCADCGQQFNHCETHGGSRAATHFLKEHARECAGITPIVVRDIDLPAHGGKAR